MWVMPYRMYVNQKRDDGVNDDDDVSVVVRSLCLGTLCL